MSVKVNENLPVNLQYQDPDTLEARRVEAVAMLKLGKTNEQIFEALRNKYSIALSANWLSRQRTKLNRQRSRERLDEKVEYAKELFSKDHTYRDVQNKMESKFGSHLPHNKLIELSKSIRGDLKPGRRAKTRLHIVPPPKPAGTTPIQPAPATSPDLTETIFKMAVASKRTVTVHPDGTITIK